MLGWILIDVVIEMKAHPWHCCFTIPLEVYTLCRRNTVLTFSRNSGSIRSFRQFHYLARTTRFQTLQQRQLSYQSAWLQPNAFDKSYGSRQATTSQKNPVTFFDSNLKARESQADIEKSWLKAHLNSLPSREDLPDTAKPEKQEAANDAILRERYARSVQANARLTLDDEPPRYSMDNHSPAYRDLIIRCTTFDAEGNIQKHSEPVAKNALCAQHNLQPRDLRKIDSRIPNVIPTM